MTCKFNGQDFSDGSIICSGGKELKCYSGTWSETGNTCTARTDEETAIYQVSFTPGPSRIEVFCSGVAGPPKPDVFSKDVGSPIKQISGRGSNILGLVSITGVGTNYVVVEVYPNTGGAYSGTAWCTVIL